MLLRDGLMQENKEEFPSLSEQGKNLSKFVVEVVKGAVPKKSAQYDTYNELIFTTHEQQDERLSICKECQYFAPKQKRCKQCGCWLTHKVKFKISECPIQKWGKIE